MTTAKTLTTQQVAAGFGVSTMAISNWRKGQKGKTALPTVEPVAGRSVLFKQSEVQAWAKKHSLAFTLTAATSAPTAKKPGPVAKVEPAKKSAEKKPVATKRAKASASKVPS